MENIKLKLKGKRFGADAFKDQKVESIMKGKDFQSVFKHKCN